MPFKVILNIGSVELAGELSDTPAGRAVAGRLPLTFGLSRWGDEYYGDMGQPMGSFEGETQQVMEIGDLAYWEPGNAFCLFFGPTPASRGDEPRAASPVHGLGRVAGDFQAVKAMGQQVTATLTAVG